MRPASKIAEIAELKSSRVQSLVKCRILQPTGINSLRRRVGGTFNGSMKMKSLLSLVLVATLLFGLTVSGQTTQVTGKVLAVTTSTITLQSGTDVWDIKRTQTTTVNGTLKVGSSVTVTYSVADGQKREGGVSTAP